MKRVVRVGCFLVAGHALVCLAQQPAKESAREGATPVGIQSSQVPSSPQPLRSFELTAADGRLPGRDGQTYPRLTIPIRILASDEPFQILNGAVYVRIGPEGPMLPMSGGGASGCFSDQVKERTARLTEYIRLLPPVVR